MPTELDGGESDRSLRADAERNRDRILSAARRLYASEGLDISMSSVAREAGVGKATLSRRFATKNDLIAAVFAEHMAGYVRATEEALANPDPWAGFTGFIETICSMQAADRGFADVLTITFPGARELEELRGSSYKGFLSLIAGAKAVGHLRADFASEDFVILLMANAGVVTATAEAAPDSWRRLVGHFLRAVATPGAPLPPMPKPPLDEDLYKAMARTT